MLTVNDITYGDISSHGERAFTDTHSMHLGRPPRRRGIFRGEAETSSFVLEENDVIDITEAPDPVTNRAVSINTKREIIRLRGNCGSISRRLASYGKQFTAGKKEWCRKDDSRKSSI